MVLTATQGPELYVSLWRNDFLALKAEEKEQYLIDNAMPESWRAAVNLMLDNFSMSREELALDFAESQQWLAKHYEQARGKKEKRWWQWFRSK